MSTSVVTRIRAGETALGATPLAQDAVPCWMAGGTNAPTVAGIDAPTAATRIATKMPATSPRDRLWPAKPPRPRNDDSPSNPSRYAQPPVTTVGGPSPRFLAFESRAGVTCTRIGPAQNGYGPGQIRTGDLPVISRTLQP